jgi:hypothetical protein
MSDIRMLKQSEINSKNLFSLANSVYTTDGLLLQRLIENWLYHKHRLRRN